MGQSTCDLGSCQCVKFTSDTHVCECETDYSLKQYGTWFHHSLVEPDIKTRVADLELYNAKNIIYKTNTQVLARKTTKKNFVVCKRHFGEQCFELDEDLKFKLQREKPVLRLEAILCRNISINNKVVKNNNKPLITDYIHITDCNKHAVVFHNAPKIKIQVYSNIKTRHQTKRQQCIW